MDNQIYLDYAASTPCDQRVLMKILPYFTTYYGNSSNASHKYGEKALEAVEIARLQVSKFLNCLPQQIIWTSGATESNNLAIQGCISAIRRKDSGRPLHIITSAIEHKAVLETCENMQFQNVEVSFVNPDDYGAISSDSIISQIRDHTCLISIMMANNEIGTINDLSEIGKVCKAKGILFHTDATQYLSHMPVDLDKLEVDMLSFSGHKLYGPKGVGALYVRDLNRLTPIMFGGGHENGYRSGTLNVPGIVGLGEATMLCIENQEYEYERISALRNMFEVNLMSTNSAIVINGDSCRRLPNITNMSFPVKEGYSILKHVSLIACSSGAACDTPQNLPSHVMIALGKSNHQAKNSLRFSLGRYTQEHELVLAIEHINAILDKICF